MLERAEGRRKEWKYGRNSQSGGTKDALEMNQGELRGCPRWQKEDSCCGTFCPNV